jgi:dolichol-phosphate mannosyltransferase
MIKRISYVVPCYNEEAVLGESRRRMEAVASGLGHYGFEFVFVNDGSTDSTAELLDGLAVDDRRVKVLHLAVNRGHQAAITAGLDIATGEAVITIDADLQDPPEPTGDILARMEEGCDMVHMKRRRRRGESMFKLITAKVFYFIMNRLASSGIQRESGDFRAVSRRALLAVRSFREQHRFMLGIFSSLGFRQSVLEFDREARHAGETKCPLMKMPRLAANALMSFFTGIIIFCLGIVATHVGRIFEQGQGRPIY